MKYLYIFKLKITVIPIIAKTSISHGRYLISKGYFSKFQLLKNEFKKLLGLSSLIELLKFL